MKARIHFARLSPAPETLASLPREGARGGGLPPPRRPCLPRDSYAAIAPVMIDTTSDML
jgi:hypothetical protein